MIIAHQQNNKFTKTEVFQYLSFIEKTVLRSHQKLEGVENTPFFLIGKQQIFLNFCLNVLI